MASHLLPTTLVGSYPQPDWLLDRAKLAKQMPPRVRAWDLWRVAPELLAEAQDDATLVAIRDQERAGLDILTDGEIRRESYSNLFANALDGLDLDNPGSVISRSGHPVPVPRVVGKLTRKHAVQVRVDPPTFLFHVNSVDLVHFSYERYLENQMREQFGFAGTPVRFSFRASNKEGTKKK